MSPSSNPARRSPTAFNPRTKAIHAIRLDHTVRSIYEEEDIVDITNSYSATSPSIHITLDHDRIVESGLSESQISSTLALFYGDTRLSIAGYDDEKY